MTRNTGSAKPRQEPGLPCPRCNEFIRMTIEDLLSRYRFFCGRCGLELNLDRRRSEKSLELLEKLQSAVDNLEAVKAAFQ